MKQHFTLGVALKSIFALGVILTLVVGCGKEEINPINPGDSTPGTNDTLPTNDSIPDVPTGGNLVVYDQDTLSITSVTLLYMETFYETIFELSNGAIVEIINNTPPIDGTQGFTTLLGVFDGSSDCCAVYIDGDFDDIFQSGSLTIHVSGDNYDYTLNAMSAGGKRVLMRYNGPITDMTSAAGDGEVTFDGSTYTIDRASCSISYGLYYYDFSDGDRNNVLGMYLPEPFYNGASFSITDQEVTEGTATLFFEFYSPLHDATGIGVSGTIESVVTGDTYIITFSGESDRGPFAGRYAGSITQTVKASLLRHKTQGFIGKFTNSTKE